MPQMYCPECKDNVKVGSNRGEQFCTEHPDARLSAKRSTSTKAPGRKGTASYDRARRIFNNVVCGERCFFADRDELDNPRRPGHRCPSFRLDAHHLVPQSWIAGNYPDLPEQDFLEIVFNPLIGAPLCRSAHDRVTLNSDYIYFDELRVEAIEFCEAVDQQWENVPLPAGGKRQSMLERLRMECPAREVVVP